MSQPMRPQSVPTTPTTTAGTQRRSFVLTAVIAVAVTVALFAVAVAFVQKSFPAATPFAPVADEQTFAQSEKTKSGGEQQDFNVDQLPPEPEIIEGGAEGEYSWTNAPLDSAVEELLNNDRIINDATATVYKDDFVGDFSRVSLSAELGVEAGRDPEQLFSMLQTLTENFCFNDITLRNPQGGPSLELAKACGGSDEQTAAYLELWEQAEEYGMQSVTFEWDSAKLAYHDPVSTNLVLLADEIKDFQNTDWDGFDYTQVSVTDTYGHYDFAMEPGQKLSDAIDAQAPWRQEAE